MRTTALALAAGFLLSPAAAAADKDKPATDPPGVPLELTVSAKKTAVPLDLGGRTPEAFAKAIETLSATGGKLPAPPAVEVTVTLKNVGDKPLRVWTDGDAQELVLTLSGDGALNVEPKQAFSADYKLPKETELAPGKSFEWEVRSLQSGFRGVSRSSYWTKPGTYDLVAAFKTGVSPRPEGAKEQDGFGLVTVTSRPLKLTVEKP